MGHFPTYLHAKGTSPTVSVESRFAPESASQLTVLRMLVDPEQLRMDAPVFRAIAAFVAHHNAGGERVLSEEIASQADG